MIRLRLDGRDIEVPEGATVAVALVQADTKRRSVSGQPREPFCGMGICWECRATVDGVAGIRTCLLPATEGMEIRTDE